MRCWDFVGGFAGSCGGGCGGTVDGGAGGGGAVWGGGGGVWRGGGGGGPGWGRGGGGCFVRGGARRGWGGVGGPRGALGGACGGPPLGGPRVLGVGTPRVSACGVRFGLMMPVLRREGIFGGCAACGGGSHRLCGMSAGPTGSCSAGPGLSGSRI